MSLWSRNSYFFLDGKTSKLEVEEAIELDVVNTIRPAIRFLNIFGLFPCRLPDKKKQPQSSPFSWTLQMTYSFGVVFLLLALPISHTYQYRKRVFEEAPCQNAACVLRQLPPLIYSYLVVFIGFYSFFAHRKFNQILIDWNRTIRMIKNCFRGPTDPSKATNNDNKLYTLPRNRIVWFALGYYGICFFEHTIGNISMTYHCYHPVGTHCEFFNYYWSAITHRKEVPIRNPIGGIIVFVTSKYALVVWNMTDFLVMIMGQCLVRNFDGFNQRLEEFVKEPKSTAQWKEVRQLHFKLCDIAHRIEQVLSPAVLFSVTVVIFFICYQIFFHFYMAIKTSNEVEIPYGLISFFQLIFRITGVSITGSNLSEKANAPLKILRQCDMDGSTLEVFGVIITYEMIFMSLNEN